MNALLTFVLLLISAISCAQNPYVFKHLNVEDGLSQSSVLSIAQDAKGFMWFGTRFGLNKYDSQNFKTYFHKAGDRNSLTSSAFISSILTLKNGTLLIGTPGGLNRYDETNDRFERITHNNHNTKSISNNKVNCLFQDRQGRLWVGTGNGLNLSLTQNNDQFKRFLFNNKSPEEVYTIYEDYRGTIWLGTTGGLVNMKMENGTLRFNYFKHFSDKLNAVVDNHITSIVEDADHNLWMGTKQTGLYKLNPRTQQIVGYKYSVLNARGISSNNVRKIIKDKTGKLWIGTLHGINIYDPQLGAFNSIQNEPGNSSSLSQNSVYALFEDRQGIIWAGSYFGAINMVYPNYTPFKVFASSNTSKGLSSQVVSSIMDVGNSNLWIGTEGEGLNYYNRKTDTYIHYKYNPNNPKSIGSNLVKSIIKDKNNQIWIGTHLGGLNRFEPSTNSFVRYMSRKNDTSSISSDEVSAVFEDSAGRFWVGTSNGLNRFDASTGKFKRNQINGLSDAVNYIFEDTKKTLWLATSSGLYYLKKGESKFKTRVADARERLNYSEINCITKDKQGFLWLGTSRNGLFKLYPDQHAYYQTTKLDGLPSNNIMGILQDDNNNLWISTDNGLCKYNPQQKTFKIYNTKDGLPGNEFNQKSFLRDRLGTFYFGGLSGMISFRPEEIKENTSIQPVIFTGLRLFGKPVSINAEGDLLNANISTVKSITFEPHQDVFTIEFTLLNFIKPEKNRYAYKLAGFEKNWNYVATPAASYTNLSPGHYTLLVKASNNDGIWTKQLSKLKIEVLPPYYRTWWAYLGYVCIIAAVLFLLIRYLLMRAVLTKEKEINEHKLGFFTNISHEIRTPLTLIVGPLERLIEKSQNEPQWSKALQPIKNNADRLMRLVTELLDFRKAESGKMQLQVSSGNVIKFCKEIFMAFQNMAISKQINYQFTTEREEIELYFDQVQMEKVLFNLLSNAFKFTPDGGTINFGITQVNDEVGITICDNGSGIPTEQQSNLFNMFYQANNNTSIGTGLGLSFSKSIVELHQGKISFKSTPQANHQPGSTCFTVTLQTGKGHFEETDFVNDDHFYDDVANYNVPQTMPMASAGNDQTAREERKYNILVVEDNDEVRAFINSSLAHLYNIYESVNGLKGFESAVEIIPDIIISDVMMPVMDGLELCRKLKTDERTSHIPVILLTARSAYIHQLNGFENGADAYIMKPFNLRILELNVHNLLNARETIKRKFAQVISLEPSNMVVNSTEQKFLTKIIQLIEDHIADTDFDVPTLASAIGMSQPVLYKKLRALTDLSVNDFIKSIRLKRSAQLLQQNAGNISEVAYAVGFNDRKYFSIEFKKHFGKSPRDFMQEQKA